jgi:hypothetical protein
MSDHGQLLAKFVLFSAIYKNAWEYLAGSGSILRAGESGVRSNRQRLPVRRALIRFLSWGEEPHQDVDGNGRQGRGA